MSTSSAGLRRLCVAVDLEAYSRRNNPDQASAQRGLVDVLQEASQHGATGQAPEAWQAQGDGALGLLPPSADETRAVADTLHELRIALSQHNRGLAEQARLRLRVAMHSGIVHHAANGFAGSAVVMVCRLLDAQPLREALRRHLATDLALIVSDQLYDDIVRHNYRDLRAETFQRVHVGDRRKGFTARAWIHVAEPVGGAAEQGDGPDEEPDADPELGNAAGGDRAYSIFKQFTVMGDLNSNPPRGGSTEQHRRPRQGAPDA